MAAIYKITCVVTDDFYIGSSVKPKRRKWEHWDMLKKGKHHCLPMQRAWDTFGPDAFEFEIIEDIADENRLLAIEDIYLSQHAGNTYCYNVATSSQISVGSQLDSREKISLSLKEYYAENIHPRQGKKHTPETLAKIAANRVPPKGENHYRYGKTLDEEIRKKIGDTQRGVPKAPRVISEEGRAKIRAAAEAGHYSNWKGKTHSEESKAKMGRSIIATDSKGVEHTYPTITALRKEMDLAGPTVDRALKSGLRLVTGKAAGWSFRYAENEKNPELEIPEKFLALPRSRQEAKEKDSRYYFTGKPCERGHIAPRLTKGACIVCRKEDWTIENEKRRMKR